MDSKKNLNWPRNSIDDIVTQCESFSISSSETDNITLDSGIFCDNKNDNIKSNNAYSGSMYNMLTSSVSKAPPPPPPYNSNHNIISGNLQTTEMSPFQAMKRANIIPYDDDSKSCDQHLSSTFESSAEYFDTDDAAHTSIISSDEISPHLTYSKNSIMTNSDTKHYRNMESGKILDRSASSFVPPIFARLRPHNTDSFTSRRHGSLKNSSSSGIYNSSDSNVDKLSLPPENVMDTHILGNCSKCHSAVTDSESACIALGRLYHSTCFVCCYCNRSLRGKVFYKDQENVYCEQDYMIYGFHKSAKICIACGHIITESILEAIGKDFHPRCFKCNVCEKCLDGIPFTVDQNNNIYCISDYHLTFAPRCAICCKPIIPCNDSDDVVRVVVNDRDFHVECYRCQSCCKSLTNDSNCFVWTTDRLLANVKLLCRKCYGDKFRKLSLVQHQH